MKCSYIVIIAIFSGPADGESIHFFQKEIPYSFNWGKKQVIVGDLKNVDQLHC